MMPIRNTDLQRTAERAALFLTNDEADEMAGTLTRVLAAFGDSRVPAGSRTPSEAGASRPVEREDVAVPWEDPDALLDAAPSRRGRYVAVPRVLPPAIPR